MSEKRDPRSFLASVLVQYGYSHEVAEVLVQRALDAEVFEAAARQREFFGDVSSQGNDGNWYGMSDWLTEDRECPFSSTSLRRLQHDD